MALYDSQSDLATRKIFICEYQHYHSQNHLFDVINSTVKDQDVREIYNLAHSRSKKAFDALEAKGYVEVIPKNPLIHKLTNKVITEID